MQIKRISEISNNSLSDFYKILYPSRHNFLSSNWEWYYRTNFETNSAPSLMVQDDEVIAHYGSIPYRASFSDSNYSLGYIIDISTHPNFRRRGLISQLEKKVMSEYDIVVGIGISGAAYHLHKNRVGSMLIIHFYTLFS